MYKVTRDNIRTYEDKLSGNDDKLQQNPETTSWFVDKDEDDQEYTCIYMATQNYELAHQSAMLQVH